MPSIGRSPTGCHLINLSLGGADADEAVRAAIGHALDSGTLVVAATGNDGRRPVAYPAAWPSSVAISAMGRKSVLPPGCSEMADVAKPLGVPDADAFVAAFSNVGPQVDFTGPGVGVVSTVPGGNYAVMSGTSMAAPAVTGFAASVLAANPGVMNLAGAARPRQLKQMLAWATRSRSGSAEITRDSACRAECIGGEPKGPFRSPRTELYVRQS